MKVLDRYLIRELLKPLLCACLVLVMLVLIADLFDNLDEFLKYKISLTVMAEYYASLVPYSLIQVLPWAAWLGTIFLLVTFGFHNEIIAMKAAGLQITAIARPIFFVGFLLGIASFLINDQVVPKTYRKATDIKEIYIDKKKNTNTEKNLKNVTYLSRRGQLYYFRDFSVHRNEVEDVVGLWLDPMDTNAKRKMVAKKGEWTGDQWQFHEVTEYHMDSRGRILGDPKIYPKKVYPEIDFTPKQLRSAASETTFLSYKELKDSIIQLRANGINVVTENTELQNRLASPWQPLVMMLICVPLLAKTTNRKLIAYNVLICVGLVFGFNVVSAVFLSLGKAGKLFQFLGAWGGNITFAIAGFIHLDRANH